MVGAGWMFAGMCDRILVDTAAEAAPRMSDFAAQRRQRFEVELSEGGWLRLTRDASGRLLIRYHFGRMQAGAALEGEIVLEAEAAEHFCKELIALLSRLPFQTRRARHKLNRAT